MTTNHIYLTFSKRSHVYLWLEWTCFVQACWIERDTWLFSHCEDSEMPWLHGVCLFVFSDLGCSRWKRLKFIWNFVGSFVFFTYTCVRTHTTHVWRRVTMNVCVCSPLGRVEEDPQQEWSYVQGVWVWNTRCHEGYDGIWAIHTNPTVCLHLMVHI